MEIYESPRLFCDEYAPDTLIASGTAPVINQVDSTNSAMQKKCARNNRIGESLERSRL